MSGNALRSTGKNTIALLAGTGVRMAASFAFVIFAAAQMGLTNFGKFSLTLFYFELFLSLTSTAVCILLTREMASHKQRSSELLTTASTFTLLLSVGGALAMVAAAQLMNYSLDTTRAIVITGMALFPAALASVLEASLVAHERAEYVTFGAVLECVVRIPLSVAVLLMGANWLAVVWILVLSRVILLIFYLWAAWQVYRPTIEFRYPAVLSFAGSWRIFVAENWMATLYISLDILMLSYFVGEVAVGLYSAAFKVVRLGIVVAKAYTTAVFPVMSRLYGDASASFGILCRQTIRVMAAVALPAVVGISVLAEETIGLLFTSEYAAAAPVLQVLVWALLVEFLNPFLSHALFAQGKQKYSMRVAAISLVVNFFLTGMLVFGYGATGAALGTVLAGFVASTCYAYYLLDGRELLAVANIVLRVTLAAACFGLVLGLPGHLPLPWRIALGTACYGILLLCVGVVRPRDFVAVRNQMLPGPS